MAKTSVKSKTVRSKSVTKTKLPKKNKSEGSEEQDDDEVLLDLATKKAYPIKEKDLKVLELFKQDIAKAKSKKKLTAVGETLSADKWARDQFEMQSDMEIQELAEEKMRGKSKVEKEEQGVESDLLEEEGQEEEQPEKPTKPKKLSKIEVQEKLEKLTQQQQQRSKSKKEPQELVVNKDKYLQTRHYKGDMDLKRELTLKEKRLLVEKMESEIQEKRQEQADLFDMPASALTPTKVQLKDKTTGETTEIILDPATEEYTARLATILSAPIERSENLSEKDELLSGESNPSKFFALQGRNRSVNDYNKLIRIQGAQKKLDLALDSFSDMKAMGLKPNVLTYTALITACAEVGDSDRALYLVENMTNEGLVPTMWTHGSIVRALVNSKDMNRAFQYVEALEKRKMTPDQVVYHTLLHGCVTQGYYTKAWETFDFIQTYKHFEPDEVTHTLMIQLAAKQQNAERALNLWEEIHLEKLRPTEVTFQSIIYACARRKDYAEKAIELFGQMKAQGFALTTEAFNTALLACTHNGDVKLARSLLKEMTEVCKVDPDEYTYNTLLSVIANAQRKPHQMTNKEENIIQALQIFNDMKSKGLPISIVTLNTLLRVFTESIRIQRATEIYEQLFTKHGIERDDMTLCHMISMFSRARRTDQCFEFLDRLRNHPNFVHRESVFLNASIRRKSGNSPNTPFLPTNSSTSTKIPRLSSPENPTATSASALVKTAAMSPNLSRMPGRYIAELHKNPDPLKFNQISEMRARERGFETVLAEEHPYTITYNDILRCCAAAKACEPAIKILKEMRSRQILPFSSYLHNVMHVCSGAQRERIRFIFGPKEMEKRM